MLPEVEPVRVTNQSFGLRKKHMFWAAGAIVLALVIGLVVWTVSGSSTRFPVRVNGRYGYIDKSAKVVISPQFDRAEPFAEGYAPVQTGNRWGYVDKTGKMVVSPQFDMADPF